jgi:hypothetical protein
MSSLGLLDGQVGGPALEVVCQGEPQFLDQNDMGHYAPGPYSLSCDPMEVVFGSPSIAQYLSCNARARRAMLGLPKIASFITHWFLGRAREPISCQAFQALSLALRRKFAAGESCGFPPHAHRI